MKHSTRRRRIRRYYSKLLAQLRRTGKIQRREAERLEAIRRRTKGMSAFVANLWTRTRTRETEGQNSGLIHLGDIRWFHPSYNYGGEWNYTPTLSGLPYVTELCQDQIHPGPPFKEGGPFRHFRREAPHYQLVGVGTYFTNPYDYKYEGGFLPTKFPPVNWDLAFSDQEVDYSAYGTTGWSRFRPGRPGADLGIFLGEIHEVPRMLRQTAKGFHDVWKSLGGHKANFGPKKVADHFLNHQFGWLPFVSDVRRFIKTYNRANLMYKQIVRDNERNIRRRGTILTTNETTLVASSDVQTAHTLCPNSYFYSDPTKTGYYKIWRRESRNIWFSAKFTYYIPNIEDVEFDPLWKAKMYGLSISPSLLYELTPWSWLIDWVSNAGDVFANLDPGLVENLVARYAFVMGKTVYSYIVESFHNIETAPISRTWSYVAKHEVRQRASPFGFGLTGIDFSARQLSILAALGESRLKWF